MVKDPITLTRAVDFLGGGLGGGVGVVGVVGVDGQWLGNLKTTLYNSVCVKPVFECEPFLFLSSLSPNCCPRSHKNNQARGVKIWPGARNVQCLKFQLCGFYPARCFGAWERLGGRGRRGLRWEGGAEIEGGGNSQRKELLDELIMQISSWWGVLSLLKQQLCLMRI